VHEKLRVHPYLQFTRGGGHSHSGHSSSGGGGGGFSSGHSHTHFMHYHNYGSGVGGMGGVGGFAIGLLIAVLVFFALIAAFVGVVIWLVVRAAKKAA